MNPLEWGIALWAAVAAGFTAVALFRLRRRPAPPADLERWPPVLLLRPLDAPTPDELRALAAPIDYPGPLEHLVLAPFRPPLPRGVRWLPSDPLTPNRKVGHVQYALATRGTIRHLVLVVDADVAVDAALVRALVAPVLQGAAVCSAAPWPEAGRGLGAAAQAGLLGHSHHSFVALQALSAGARTMSGKAVAFSPRALDVLRGLDAHVGEDLELALRLHRAGEQVALSPLPARIPQGAPAWSTVRARFTRWMRVLRAHRPALYPTVPLLFAPTPALLLLALWSAEPAALGAVGGLVGLRTALALRLGALAGGGEGALRAGWSWLLGEALLWGAFTRSLLRREVEWRGRRYRVGAGGRMEVAA